MTNKKQHAGAPIKALLGRKLGMTQVGMPTATSCP